jgi:integrase/recombinase XerD
MSRPRHSENHPPCDEARYRHASLLQAGVDMATIALWLGHESIETTHVYIQTDLAIKEQVLAKLNPVDGTMARFTADDPLLEFLASL